MQEFYFNSREIQKICVSFTLSYQTLHQSSNTLWQITKSFQDIKNPTMLKSLNQILTDLKKREKELLQLKETLEKILTTYLETENSICNNSNLCHPFVSSQNIQQEKIAITLSSTWNKTNPIEDIRKHSGEEIHWKNLLNEYLPENFSSDIWLSFYAFAEKINTLDKNTILKHKSLNINAWQEYQKNHSHEKYIENQRELTNMQYGFFSGNKNTCGVIATYNALQSITNGTSTDIFPELLEYYEQHGIALNGAMGTAPQAIHDFFQNKNYRTKLLTGNDISPPNLASLNFCTYILLSHNDKSSITSGLHYVCITKENLGYLTHNGTSNKTYNSLEDAIFNYNNGKGDPLTLICIK